MSSVKAIAMVPLMATIGIVMQRAALEAKNGRRAINCVPGQKGSAA